MKHVGFGWNKLNYLFMKNVHRLDGIDKIGGTKKGQ